MNYSAVIVVLFLLTGCSTSPSRTPAASCTDWPELESICIPEIVRMQGLPYSNRVTRASQMAEALAAMDFVLLTKPASTNIVDSDLRVIVRVYGAFIGDLQFLRRQQATNAISRRVTALIHAYPISSPVLRDEQVMLVLVLGQAAQSVPGVVEKDARAKAGQEGLSADARVPLRAILAECDTPLTRDQIRALDDKDGLKNYRYLYRLKAGERAQSGKRE